MPHNTHETLLSSSITEPSPLVLEAVKHIDGLFDIQTATSSRQQRLLEALGQLAQGFAFAMLSHDMPVDRAVEIEYEQNPEDKYRPEEIGRTLVPLWVIIQNKDLSGRELRDIDLTRTQYRHHVSAGFVTDSRDTYMDIEPEKFRDFSFMPRDNIRYDETAIGVTPVGEMLRLRRWRRFRGHETWRLPSGRSGYEVSGKVGAPSLFDPETTQSSTEIIEAMTKRLEAAQHHYSKEHDQEEDDRGLHYYFPEKLFVPAKVTAAPGRKRGWFGRRRP